MVFGTITDVINAKKVELILGGEEFALLQEITMPLSRPETREAVELGSVYFYGQHENTFDATFLLSGLTIPLFLDNNLIVDGALVEQTYDIRLTSKSGNVVTIRVTAVTPEQEIEKLPDGGVKIYQTFRITEDVDSGNIV